MPPNLETNDHVPVVPTALVSFFHSLDRWLAPTILFLRFHSFDFFGIFFFFGR